MRAESRGLSQLKWRAFMEPNFLSIIPPFIVLTLGFLTRKILWSLAVGILAASWICSKNFFESFVLSFEKFFKNTELQLILEGQSSLDSYWNLLIAIFLLILGVFITLLHYSGAAKGYERFVKKKLRTKKHAEASSLLLSTALFVDDYFSSLTVGSVMRSVTDPFKVPRAKLAFLVDSMAAPLAIICPISSWVAATVGFLRDSGFSQEAGSTTLIHGTPYAAYLNTLPYILYSFAVIIGSWVIVLFGLSFGKMHKHEKLAQDTGDLFGGNAPEKQQMSGLHKHKRGSMSDFSIMILTLIIAVLCGLAYSGGWSLFGGNLGLFAAFRNSSAAHGLFAAGLFILCFQILWMLLRGLIVLKDLPYLIYSGVKLMFPSVLVLLLAWTLGDLLRNDLKTGLYLAQIFTKSLSVQWLPFMFFIGATVTATCIGSSWGAAAVMFPIAVQMYLSMNGISTLVSLEEVQSLFPLLGAVLSGAVAGDHISPISDTTIMSATSTGMNHADHVDTQIGYAIPLIGVTALSFATVGFVHNGQSWWIPYLILAFVVPLTLLGIAKFSSMKKQNRSAS